MNVSSQDRSTQDQVNYSITARLSNLQVVRDGKLIFS